MGFRVMSSAFQQVQKQQQNGSSPILGWVRANQLATTRPWGEIVLCQAGPVILEQNLWRRQKKGEKPCHLGAKAFSVLLSRSSYLTATYSLKWRWERKKGKETVTFMKPSFFLTILPKCKHCIMPAIYTQSLMLCHHFQHHLPHRTGHKF